VLLLVAAVVGVWQYAIRWHPSDVQFPTQGIDISHHQGVIDWRLLPGQGVDFAYIKATEGSDHRDTNFFENWVGSARAHIPHGAYHFFTLCSPGAAQAANFIAMVPDEPTMLPPVVDLEFMGNCGERLPPDRLRTELSAFIAAIEAHYRKPVTLYLTREFDAGYGISRRYDRKLWLRNLVFEPHWGAQPWSLWQVSNFRNLNGIDGRVDWNVARP